MLYIMVIKSNHESLLIKEQATGVILWHKE
jgi:hypothetical protein